MLWHKHLYLTPSEQGCKFAFVFKCECDGFAKCEYECDENAKALRILNANASHFFAFAFSHFSANRKMRNATFFFTKK